MKFRIIPTILIGLIVFVVLALYLAMSLPLSLFFSDEMSEMGITDISGASVAKGDVWVSHPSVSGLIAVSYAWCPKQGIGSWCATVSGDHIEAKTVLTPRPSSLSLTDTEIEKFSTLLLGGIGSAIGGTIDGTIQEARFSSYQCPLQNLQFLNAQLHIANVNVLGSAMGEHNLAAKTVGPRIEAEIVGESLDGLVTLADGDYEASGELVATDMIAAMARSFMRPLGGDRYGWEIRGAVPC